jgi:phage anti-repressor protein
MAADLHIYNNNVIIFNINNSKMIYMIIYILHPPRGEQNNNLSNNYNRMISLIDFLKKYSTIPNQFIDDFYKIIDYKEINNNEMTIDLNDVVKWLNIQKKKAKETLIKSYKKGIDYEIIKEKKSKGSGGHNNELILLTIKCFKKFCQLTRSKHGDEVREYFIQVESILNKYKNYIIEGMEDKIKKIQKGKKPKVNPEKGVIYVFKTPDTTNNNLYKIGRTKDLKKRLQSHQSPLSEDIDILFISEVYDTVAVEKCVKGFMKMYQYRKYKEIYQVNLEIIKELTGKCSEIDANMEIKKKMKDDKEEEKKYYIFIDK